MIKDATATGNTLDEAKEAAVAALGVDDNVEIMFDIIETPQKKILGLFGGSQAKVRAYVEIEDEVKPAKTSQNKTKSNKNEKAEVKSAPIEDKVPITDPKKLEFADRASKYLGNILELMNIKADLVASDYDGGVELTLNGDRLGVIVGKRGETLDALQYLTVLAANTDKANYQKIILNTGDYRVKRSETLKALATKTANQAIKNNKNIALDCMNPYERRIIHMIVQSIDGVSSWSIGEEPRRRVVIGVDPNGTVSFPGRRGNNNRRSSNRSGGNSRAKKQTPSADRDIKKDSSSVPLYGKLN